MVTGSALWWQKIVVVAVLTERGVHKLGDVAMVGG